VRITGGPAFPFAQPVLWSRDYRSSAAQLVRQRPAVKRNQVERLRQQLLSQGVRGAETAYIQRSALANMPKRVLISSGMNVISSAASALKASLQSSLAPHMERLKALDARYQQALDSGASEAVLAQIEQEMRAVEQVMQGIIDELTKLYGGFADAVTRIYSGLTGGEFSKTVEERVKELDPNLLEKDKFVDFSAKGLGIDSLGFRYADVKAALDGAFETLSIYEKLASERNNGFGLLIRSIGFERVSDPYQFGFVPKKESSKIDIFA